MNPINSSTNDNSSIVNETVVDLKYSNSADKDIHWWRNRPTFRVWRRLQHVQTKARMYFCFVCLDFGFYRIQIEFKSDFILLQF